LAKGAVPIGAAPNPTEGAVGKRICGSGKAPLAAKNLFPTTGRGHYQNQKSNKNFIKPIQPHLSFSKISC
jgi:hypothetical protein